MLPRVIMRKANQFSHQSIEIGNNDFNIYCSVWYLCGHCFHTDLWMLNFQLDFLLLGGSSQYFVCCIFQTNGVILCVLICSLHVQMNGVHQYHSKSCRTKKVKNSYKYSRWWFMMVGSMMVQSSVNNSHNTMQYNTIKARARTQIYCEKEKNATKNDIMGLYWTCTVGIASRFLCECVFDYSFFPWFFFNLELISFVSADSIDCVRKTLISCVCVCSWFVHVCMTLKLKETES